MNIAETAAQLQTIQQAMILIHQSPTASASAAVMHSLPCSVRWAVMRWYGAATRFRNAMPF